jgi:hypothetical protein
VIEVLVVVVVALSNSCKSLVVTNQNVLQIKPKSKKKNVQHVLTTLQYIYAT